MENSRNLRVSTLFQTIEKLNTQRQTQKFTQDDVGQLRYCTHKILQLVSSQEKAQKDSLMKHHLDTLLAVLDITNDTGVLQNTIHLLLEYIGKSHTGKRASVLVSNGATQLLLHLLVKVSREGDETELLMNIHQVLAKLALKDRKLGVRTRLSGALPVTLNLIRDLSVGMKALQPVLTVLKYCASNSVNASFLGKNGAISYLFKILNYCGRKYLNPLKTSLDTLGQLLKSKSNSARAIGQGGIPTLLNMFYDWHRFDSKNRHINLRKSILNVLKNVTNLKSGRRAFKEADGIRILYTACQESMEIRELEGLIFTASVIMRKCFPKNRLPLSNLKSVLSHHLPQSDFHVLEAVSDDGSGAGMDPRTGDGDDSSVDNDDDISSDDDPESNKIEAEEDAETDNNNDPPYRRTAEELMVYETFFPELVEFEVISSDSEDLDDQAYGAISQKMQSSHRSSPCLRNCTPSGGKLTGALSQMRVGANCEGNFSENMSFLGPQNLRPKFTTGLLSDRKLEEANKIDVSAVNMKTGMPVFSLDFSPKVGRRAQSPKVLKRQTAKARPITSSSNSRPKSRKNGRKLEEPQTLMDDFYPTSVNVPLSDSAFYDDQSATTLEEEDEGCMYDSPEVFGEFARRTKTVGRCNKLAYPDLHGHKPPPFHEPLFDRKFGVQRAKIFEDIDRMLHPDQVIDRVVYDLDSIAERAGYRYTDDFSNLTNSDELRVGKVEDYTDCLQFNSQFECGNLRKAIQVRQYEYDLILNPDVNTNHHHQWFYFEVSNMEAGIPYRFNIINCEKLNSQFNFGMKPLMYSVAEAMEGRPHWVRAGKSICYYRNHFVRSSHTTGGVRGKAYYTATFTIQFNHDRDVCYLAYHYPYSYTMLQAHIYKWENMHDINTIYFRHQTLCDTLSGNPVPVLTITAIPQCDKDSIEQFKNRPYIFLSSRVHPGESNASWVMKGTIQFLLSDKPAAQNLREMFIFKIVPMLNPDGVLNGNHRCSLTAEDLNRRWMHPCPKLHPTIYHCKGLLQYMKMIGKAPLVYCDYHGHSRRKNVFLYGCSPSMSWMTEDYDNPAIIANKVEDLGYKTLPRLVNQVAPQFSLSNCSYMVEKSKESTARVVVWRQVGVVRSYTMESTFCGFDQGLYKGTHIGIKELEEMGHKFCEALLKVKSRHVKLETQPSSEDSAANKPSPDEPQLDGATALAGTSFLNSKSPELDLLGVSESSSSCESDDEEEEDDDLDVEIPTQNL